MQAPLARLAEDQPGDTLTADLIGAGLTYTQLYAVQSTLTAARNMTTAVREQTDYQSDVWNDMAGLFEELGMAVTSLLAAMRQRTALDYPGAVT